MASALLWVIAFAVDDRAAQEEEEEEDLPLPALFHASLRARERSRDPPARRWISLPQKRLNEWSSRRVSQEGCYSSWTSSLISIKSP